MKKNTLIIAASKCLPISSIAKGFGMTKASVINIIMTHNDKIASEKKEEEESSPTDMKTVICNEEEEDKEDSNEEENKLLPH